MSYPPVFDRTNPLAGVLDGISSVSVWKEDVRPIDLLSGLIPEFKMYMNYMIGKSAERKRLIREGLRVPRRLSGEDLAFTLDDDAGYSSAVFDNVLDTTHASSLAGIVERFNAHNHERKDPIDFLREYVGEIVIHLSRGMRRWQPHSPTPDVARFEQFYGLREWLRMICWTLASNYFDMRSCLEDTEYLQARFRRFLTVFSGQWGGDRRFYQHQPSFTAEEMKFFDAEKKVIEQEREEENVRVVKRTARADKEIEKITGKKNNVDSKTKGRKKRSKSSNSSGSESESTLEKKRAPKKSLRSERVVNKVVVSEEPSKRVKPSSSKPKAVVEARYIDPMEMDSEDEAPPPVKVNHSCVNCNSHSCVCAKAPKISVTLNKTVHTQAAKGEEQQRQCMRAEVNDILDKHMTDTQSRVSDEYPGYRHINEELRSFMQDRWTESSPEHLVVLRGDIEKRHDALYDSLDLVGMTVLLHVVKKCTNKRRLRVINQKIASIPTLLHKNKNLPPAQVKAKKDAEDVKAILELETSKEEREWVAWHDQVFVSAYASESSSDDDDFD